MGNTMNMNRRVALGLAAAIPAGLLKLRAASAAPGDNRPSPDSPLHRYIGSWRGEVTVESSGKPAVRYVQENTFAWTLGGRFLEERGTDSNGGSFAGIWAFDASANKYRAHYFVAPSGDDLVIVHAWNPAKQAFVGNADLPGGVRMLAEDRFLGPDSYIWLLTIQDQNGKTLSRTEGKEHRIHR
jgi:hypothetical protein